MTHLLINEFNECQQCADCCKTPCDIIPDDLPPLLDKFNLSLQDFFKKYLISLIIQHERDIDVILMMVPVRIYTNGDRSSKYLADNQYINTPGRCIFLEGRNCLIHELKPFGGRFAQCSKMTGSVSIGLFKSKYYAYWFNNQHLFELIFPEAKEIFAELSYIHNEMNRIWRQKADPKDSEYNKLNEQRGEIVKTKLFKIFNNSLPIDGWGAQPRNCI